ncbi:MAG: hypothetical protein NTW04_01360 [Elusimicrobia bacterium]|nr:hypothetical protein [Elusimicrobiota bacterium]
MTGKLLFLLANILFPVLALLWAVVFLLTPRRKLLGSFWRQLRERCGMSPAPEFFKKGNALWFHCASVGEARSLAGIISGVKKHFPDRPVLITTLTAAGKAQAQKFPSADFVTLAPLDFYPFVSNFIKAFRPSHLFVAETELWPSMFVCSRSAGVKITIINGRISQKSIKIYRLAAPLFKMLADCADFVCAQTSSDEKRYIQLGFAPEKIAVTGNIKYDLPGPGPDSQSAKEVFSKLGWNDCKIIVCGSTHSAEEYALIAAFAEVKKQIPDAKLVLAPRHLERVEGILKKFSQHGVALLNNPETYLPPKDILILDEIGKLAQFYVAADVCFVGGTIEKKGGHNLLEAAICRKPVVFGQSTENLADVAEALLAEGGGFRVGENNIAETFIKLLSDAKLAKESGINAGNTALKFKGAAEKTMAAIAKALNAKPQLSD